jgi:hypothetical protein
MCFVAESEDGEIVGYIVGAPDYDSLRSKVEIAWVPELRRKYPAKLPQDVCDRYHSHHAANHDASPAVTPSPLPTPTEKMPVDGEDEDFVAKAAEAIARSTGTTSMDDEDLMLGPLEEALRALHADDACCMPAVPRPVLTSHPAIVRTGVLASADPSLPKKLITCLMAALRSTGENVSDDRLIDYTSKKHYE